MKYMLFYQRYCNGRDWYILYGFTAHNHAEAETIAKEFLNKEKDRMEQPEGYLVADIGTWVTAL